MKKQKIMSIFFLLSFFMITSAIAETCNNPVTTSGLTNGTDIMGITTETYSVIPMGSNQTFGALTFMTPRLNFSHNVTDRVVGGTAGSTSTLNWENYVNFSTTLVLINATDLVPIVNVEGSNYTLINTTPTTWAIKWTTAKFDEAVMIVYYNRTFVKNVDDIIASPGTMYAGTTKGYYITETGGSTLGEDKNIRFNGALLGNSTNNSNWAVGWTYSNRACTSYTLPLAAASGITATQVLIFAGFGLLGVMLLVIVAFALIKMFESGDMDLMTVGVFVLGGAIVLFVAYYIISMVASALLG